MRKTLVVIVYLFFATMACAEQPEAVHLYSDGPLTASDFAGEVPNPVPTHGPLRAIAYTYSEIRYSFNYRYTTKNGTTTAAVTSIDVKARLRPKLSWNQQPNSVRILDHEQGHFDIAEIFARDWSDEMHAKMAAGKLKAVSTSETEAQQALQEIFDRDFSEMKARLGQAQIDYDRDTCHGTKTEAQAAARKSQREQLAKKRDEKTRPAGKKKPAEKS